MHLESDHAIHFAFGFLVVSNIDRHRSIQFVNQAVAPRNDRQLVPLRQIDRLELTIQRRRFLLPRLSDNDLLTSLSNNASTFFVVQHPGEFGLTVNVCLVTNDDPVTASLVMLRPVLHAGIVVTFQPEFAAKLKVRGLAIPDQKLVVGKVILTSGLARDAAILNRP